MWGKDGDAGEEGGGSLIQSSKNDVGISISLDMQNAIETQNI